MFWLLIIPVAVIAIVARYGLVNMNSERIQHAASSAYKTTKETAEYLNDGEVAYGKNYSILRHTRPFIYYAGIRTVVPLSVFGDQPLPKDRRVFLQKRGYRTGLLGWTVGSVLGGSHLPGIEVTPVSEEPWSSPTKLSEKQQVQYDKDVARLFDSSYAPGQKLLQTMLVHIPVASGDGYFRLRITNRQQEMLAESPVFRVGSLTWSSAQPRGATPITIIPELGVRAAFLTAKVAAWTAFFSAFPFLKLAEWMPGGWGERAMRTAYRLAGGEQKKQELDQRYKVSESWQKANEQFYQKVPFGAAGVRTAADLERDEMNGPAGVWYNRS